MILMMMLCTALMDTLMGFEFCFLLTTFNSVFAYSDVLFGIL